jgi:uncharacterized membrane protein
MSNLPEKSLNNKGEPTPRFDYIDQFRGLIIILMLVDHASYYFNSIWLYLDPFDPLFASWGQVALRYVGYLCAPGFLMMAGAMIWWSYQRNLAKGTDHWTIRWQLIQRGLFLVLLQITWVNSSWGGFRTFNPWHLGIIASIGLSMLLLALIVHLRWHWQLIIALAILLVHPFLIQIPYNPDIIWQEALMQTFIDAGRFNKYPVLPWFALAVLGSVMATGWLQVWKTDKKKILMSLLIALAAMVIATAIRLGRSYGNIFPFSEFGTYSFFFDQKYPPSLYFSLWFFGLVVLGVAGFIAIGKYAPKLLQVFTIPGKVALFFYLMHIAIMGVFSKRFGFFYREGEVVESLIGVAVMLLIMLPLCKWFYGVKSRSSNRILRMI